ncbi:aryl-hydrocarbon-interacting protein-like 1 [Ambystoma mexicanum]|uniref:aryl-hydrocarbon-interacting protein-like 1 n=1 Tax=Ambystoma mexicanum TaxID=8296 RepID=UPI0037E92099
MEGMLLLDVEGVRKTILHGGHGDLPHIHDGSKLTFHFQTLAADFERTVIDDSRSAGIPMEIITGKLFKMEVWETLLASMRIGEVSEFWCDVIHTGMYALVSKGMRRIAEGKDPLEGQKHRCGMGNMFDYHTTGYADLDELQKNPQPLIFIMELLKVEGPATYKQDIWAMNKEEKLRAVPILHQEGNQLVKHKKYREAAEKYQEAVVCLRNVQAKEKPGDTDWLRLDHLITPLVLNYCQCQLELGEYYEVLQHTTEILHKHNDNVKAYYKRAKAHSAIWNEKEAREDFLRAAHLDPSLTGVVKRELMQLGARMRGKKVEEQQRMQELLKGRLPQSVARLDVEDRNLGNESDNGQGANKVREGVCDEANWTQLGGEKTAEETPEAKNESDVGGYRQGDAHEMSGRIEEGTGPQYLEDHEHKEGTGDYEGNEKESVGDAADHTEKDSIEHGNPKSDDEAIIVPNKGSSSEQEGERNSEYSE